MLYRIVSVGFPLMVMSITSFAAETANDISSTVNQENRNEITIKASGEESLRAPKQAPGSLYLGLGLAAVNSEDGGSVEGGWDFRIGYDSRVWERWNVGGELHFINGWTQDKYHVTSPTDLYFNSRALYLTARPEGALDWLQFRTGAVSADYYSLKGGDNGTGMAIGAGIVVGGENVKFHIFDYDRYVINGHAFNVYSANIAIVPLALFGVLSRR